jgi:hypothetical protein
MDTVSFDPSSAKVSSSEMIADEGVIDKNGWLAFLSELEAKTD